MQILELHLKNFGKFHDYHVYFDEQMEVISGENEYGKSTIFAFIKAMLFGMERGRGRGALKGDFSRYEPWENPNYYAGMMRFRCGNRQFRLERNFDRYAKSASLICENDGEELSIEDGDLEMLLGGMTATSFENVAAIGQLTAKPGQELAAQLQNYAANYYETGSGSIDLPGAFDTLKARKKQVEQARKEKLEERRGKWKRLEEQKQYVAADAEQIQRKLAEVEGRRQKLRQKIEQENQRQLQQDHQRQLQQESQQENQRQIQSRGQQRDQQGTQRKEKESRHGVPMASVLLLILGVLSLVLGGVLITSSSLGLGLGALVIGALLLIGGLFRWNQQRKNIERRNQESQRREQQYREQKIREQDLQRMQQQGEEGTAKTFLATLTEQWERCNWELTHFQEERKEKQLMLQNLQEQMEELEEESSQERALRKKGKALELAEEKLKQAAEEMVSSSGERMNRTASAILYEITDGKYARLLVNENLEMAVLCDGKRIPAERLSRGTLEQIYFSIRMAALDLLYEEEFPVIFDDAFVCYDEKRLKSVLKWLREQPRQVIIFSCQTREKKWKDEVQ